MLSSLIVLVFIIICGAIGYFVFTGLFDLIVGKNQDSTFIDKSVHHHYHDNRSITYEGETHTHKKID